MSQKVAPIVPDKVKPEFKFIYGFLRSITSEALGLDEALRAVEDAFSETDSTTLANKVKAAATDSVSRLAANKTDVDEKFEKVKVCIEKDADAANQFSETVTTISNSWQEINRGQWPNQKSTTDEIRVKTTKARTLLKNMTYHCGKMTIPSRLNEQLKAKRVGQTLIFKDVFEDELPDEGDRLKLLQYLSESRFVNGVVDVENRLIYKAAETNTRRLLSYLVISLAILMGGVLANFLPVIAQNFGIPGLPTDLPSTKLLFGYLTVVLGGMVHLGVDALKQVKEASTKSRSTILAIGDWLTWIHIRELYVIAGVFSFWIGFFGLVFYLKDIEFLTAFLVGYSIDSFVDLFMNRFTADIGKATEMVSNRLKV